MLKLARALYGSMPGNEHDGGCYQVIICMLEPAVPVCKRSRKVTQGHHGHVSVLCIFV